jgi:DNA-binding MarR family transcriptional regulator
VPSIDRIVHERARLLILTYLASNEKEVTSFNELQEKLAFTSGNLSVQLSRLKEAGYVKIEKTFKNNKPYTTISITPGGIKALSSYIDEMERIIKTLKTKTHGPGSDSDNA